MSDADATSERAVVITGPEPNWQRLHPVTVIRELLALVWNFVAALVVSGALPSFGGGIIGVEEVLPVAVVAFGVLRYLFTCYAITDDAVLYRRGVIVRQRTALPRARIQNVSIGADIVGRVFSMQTLTISSAGSQGEIELAVVSKDTARRLLATLTDQVTKADGFDRATTPGSSLAPPGGPPLLDPTEVGLLRGQRVERYRLSTRQFLVYAVSSRVVVLGVIALLVMTVGSLVSGSGFGIIWMVGLVVPIVAVLDLNGFTLETEADRLRVSHGLFSTREKWARKERIQLLEVRRPFVRQRLGVETLAIATADVAESNSGRFDLCAPIIKSDSWTEFLPDLVGIPPDPVSEDDLQRVSPLTVRRRAIRSVVVGLIPISLVAAFIGVGTSSGNQWPTSAMWWWPLCLLPVLVVAAIALARRAYAVDGWCVSTPYLIVRRGRIDETLRLIRISKLQSVSLTSSFFQRRLGLVTLIVDTANLGVPTVVRDLPIDEGEFLASQLAGFAGRISLPDGV